MSDSATNPTDPAPTVTDALHTTLDVPFEDAIVEVQLDHELAGFETVAVTRIDHLVKGALEEEINRIALLIVCQAEIAKEAVDIDPTLAGLLPCTTVVYEDDDGVVHAHHTSATKAIRDLGYARADPGSAEDIEALVEHTGALMTEVWSNVERIGDGGESP